MVSFTSGSSCLRLTTPLVSGVKMVLSWNNQHITHSRTHPGIRLDRERGREAVVEEVETAVRVSCVIGCQRCVFPRTDNSAGPEVTCASDVPLLVEVNGDPVPAVRCMFGRTEELVDQRSKLFPPCSDSIADSRSNFSGGFGDSLKRGLDIGSDETGAPSTRIGRVSRIGANDGDLHTRFYSERQNIRRVLDENNSSAGRFSEKFSDGGVVIGRLRRVEGNTG